MGGLRSAHRHVAERHRRRDRPGTGDDAVRDRRVLDRPQLVDPFDLERRRSDPPDSCTHVDQHPADVHDLRFPGRVVDDARALGEDSGHHQVLGRADAREVEPDLCAG